MLTERQTEFIEEMVSTGRYQNASEVLREGLRMVEERQRTYEAGLDAIRAKVRVAADQIDAGEGVRVSDEEQLESYLAGAAQRAKSRVARRHATGGSQAASE
ncbi:type II toxin-antitoxin system ParD family antitoxin [Nocardioides hungaricus]